MDVCMSVCLLTFHSKPVTAMPPAAPVPARPINKPEPSELAKRDAPICSDGRSIQISEVKAPIQRYKTTLSQVKVQISSESELALLAKYLNTYKESDTKNTKQR